MARYQRRAQEVRSDEPPRRTRNDEVPDAMPGDLRAGERDAESRPCAPSSSPATHPRLAHGLPRAAAPGGAGAARPGHRPRAPARPLPQDRRGPHGARHRPVARRPRRLARRRRLAVCDVQQRDRSGARVPGHLHRSRLSEQAGGAEGVERRGPDRPRAARGAHHCVRVIRGLRQLLESCRSGRRFVQPQMLSRSTLSLSPG